MNKIFSSIPEAIQDIQKGKMLIVLDSSSRENEADFYIPADKITPKIITTMIRMGGGLVCTAITQRQAHNVALPLMVDSLENTETTGVNFTVSVNAKKGITTGISAYDRAKTIQVLADPKSKPDDLTRPGHVFGLIAKNGGVCKRAGHTEAAMDLAKLAGFNPAGVLCEILADDGKMAKLPHLNALAKKFNMKVILIEDLITYLKVNPLPVSPAQSDVIKVASSRLPTKYGIFTISVYKSLSDNREHIALLYGQMKDQMMVRIHSQCLTGDTFLSLKCDCGIQLHQSMRLIRKKGSGIILYLDQEGRGIGLVNKIKAYFLQDLGQDTVEANHTLGLAADIRQYRVAADILKDLGIHDIALLTNNPDKVQQLLAEDIAVIKTIPLETKPNSLNRHYLLTKKQKLSHRLRFV